MHGPFGACMVAADRGLCVMIARNHVCCSSVFAGSSGGSEQERERTMAAIVFLVFGAHVVSWIVLPSHRVEQPVPALTVSAPAMAVASATA